MGEALNFKVSQNGAYNVNTETLQKTLLKKINHFALDHQFDGFTKQHLFIKRVINNSWGQDIAALSNMAEAIRNLSVSGGINLKDAQTSINGIVDKALHPKVSPYKADITNVSTFGNFGYYLEHLNIILGCFETIGGGKYKGLNEKISKHLLELSLSNEDYHARLLPNVKMKWSADQAAIIYSLYLFDKNNGTDFHSNLARHWLKFLRDKSTHNKTGLFKTEVTGTKKYSGQPRGCSHSYMTYYMAAFAPEVAQEQWALFKEHMLIEKFGVTGFREYLPEYRSKWTPDTGPIFFGIGVAASGLALKSAATLKDHITLHRLTKVSLPLLTAMHVVSGIPIIKLLTAFGTDLLATSILLNALSIDKSA